MDRGSHAFQSGQPPGRRWRCVAGCLILLITGLPPGGGASGAGAPEAGAGAEWKSDPPADCPFPPSRELTACRLTGRHAVYTAADTWYPSWGQDGDLYSPFADTIADGVNGVQARSDRGSNSVVGHAILTGDDPMRLNITEPGVVPGPGRQYAGRYPCASLSHDGVWYLGTYGLATADYGLNWPVLGPFAGFHISRDRGKTWTPSPHGTDVGRSLFPEPATFGGPVKMGAPRVVDFGRNQEHSPDGKLYLVGHGSTEADREDRQANLSWVTGDQIYLCRVELSPEAVNDPGRYEYFAGHAPDGTARWSPRFSDLRPIAEWDNHMGCVSMTYVAPLKKYVMCVTDGWPTVSKMSTFLLESSAPTGPWRLVHYFKEFGPQAYFVNLPSKFIRADGRGAWLCYSANFAFRDTRRDPEKGRPRGSAYGLVLQEVVLEPAAKR